MYKQNTDSKDIYCINGSMLPDSRSINGTKLFTLCNTLFSPNLSNDTSKYFHISCFDSNPILTEEVYNKCLKYLEQNRDIWFTKSNELYQLLSNLIGQSPTSCNITRNCFEAVSSKATAVFDTPTTTEVDDIVRDGVGSSYVTFPNLMSLDSNTTASANITDIAKNISTTLFNNISESTTFQEILTTEFPNNADTPSSQSFGTEVINYETSPSLASKVIKLLVTSFNNTFNIHTSFHNKLTPENINTIDTLTLQSLSTEASDQEIYHFSDTENNFSNTLFPFSSETMNSTCATVLQSLCTDVTLGLDSSNNDLYPLATVREAMKIEIEDVRAVADTVIGLVVNTIEEAMAVANITTGAVKSTAGLAVNIIEEAIAVENTTAGEVESTITGRQILMGLAAGLAGVSVAGILAKKAISYYYSHNKSYTLTDQVEPNDIQLNDLNHLNEQLVLGDSNFSTTEHIE